MTTRPPNILVIMSDEHAPQFSGFGGHPLVRTPHLDTLASRGVTFPFKPDDPNWESKIVEAAKKAAAELR